MGNIRGRRILNPQRKQYYTMKQQLEQVMKQYIEAFEKKHDMFFEFAVNDEYLGVFSFGDVYYFNASDIVYDIDKDLPKHLIIDWLHDNLDNEGNYINLHSYAKGLRHTQITNQ